GVVTVLAPILQKVLHRVAACRVPKLIRRVELAAFDRGHELAHAALFPEVRELVREAADEDEYQRNADGHLEPFLDRPRSFGNGMVVVEETADELVRHINILLRLGNSGSDV